MARPPSDKKRYSIGIFFTPEEIKLMKIKTRDLKAKYGYSRNDILRAVLVHLLDDEHLINLAQRKGGLRNKNISYRRHK
ncbi:hypothetical protein LCX93_06495 [Sulfurimonas sp. SWIR-19]|uniref:hypothetical protein n=1 Tax=Sulfurimonas sp. SWIR-19 TaxID=2878390 RepID=UPI001CF21C0F|nr:hypothetical protein [Sulfurimonas sp. SWIR-19]UCM99189.1 hypothetical protein LCX93_06495 [Sulfurimonas sp. SWIR-19]